MNKTKSIIALGIALAIFTFHLFADPPVKYTSVRLAWDPSPSAFVNNYRLYYGAEGSAITNSVVVPSFSTTALVPGLFTRTSYVFFVVAVGNDGTQSLPSNRVRYTTPRR